VGVTGGFRTEVQLELCLQRITDRRYLALNKEFTFKTTYIFIFGCLESSPTNNLHSSQKTKRENSSVYLNTVSLEGCRCSKLWAKSVLFWFTWFGSKSRICFLNRILWEKMCLFPRDYLSDSCLASVNKGFGRLILGDVVLFTFHSIPNKMFIYESTSTMPKCLVRKLRYKSSGCVSHTC
jgi:hypothetical protein